jgi:calcineurin-like phosphoesterase
LPQRFETATENPRLNGVIVKADETTGRAISVERVNLSAKQIEALSSESAAVR